MTDAIVTFVEHAPPLDSVREEAARCCDEKSRYERRERGRLRNPVDHGDDAEFSDAAFGVAAEVAMHVAEALKRSGVRFSPEFAWSTAAIVLRAGWQRGQQLAAHITGPKVQS